MTVFLVKSLSRRTPTLLQFLLLAFHPECLPICLPTCFFLCLTHTLLCHGYHLKLWLCLTVGLLVFLLYVSQLWITKTEKSFS